MTEFHSLFFIAMGLVVIGWGVRGWADDPVTVYHAPAASSAAAGGLAPDGTPIVHKSFHKHHKKPTAVANQKTPSGKKLASSKKKKTPSAAYPETVITTLAPPISGSTLSPGLTIPDPRETVTVPATDGGAHGQITMSAPEPSASTASSPPGAPPRPEVETGLPVARPGYERSTVTVGMPVPSGLAHHHESYSSLFPPVTSALGTYDRTSGGKSALDNFTFTNFDHRAKNFYPWKKDIITTIFWIGEGSTPISSTTNEASAWDQDWTYNNGGTDSPYSRDGYASKNHAATINPFYVALPFNDLAFPDKARRWLPAGWYRPPRDGKPVSACKDRWVEIKNGQGDVCYAQWEDVGPLRYDHAEYVFGDDRPDTYTRAGLDVSPAVADYLHISERNRYTSWRFVDDADVRPGAWLLYDEQALLYKAMHQLNDKNDPTRIQPIQDATTPLDDQSDLDSNKKKIGAAKG